MNQIVNRSLKDEIRDYWTVRSATFDEQVGHEIFSDAERRAWLALFRKHLGTDGGKALDLACGTGVISILLSEVGFQVTGLDLTEAMLERAKAKTAGRGIKARLYMGDAEDTLEPGDAYDAVATRHLVWTLPDPATAFAEWFRVLKPGGRLLIVDGDFVNPGARSRLLFALSRLVKRFSAETPPPVDRAAHESIQSRVYFAKGTRADEVVALLRAAGFADIVVDRKLGAIHRAQGRYMPLHKRLLRASEDRYAISAHKPAR